MLLENELHQLSCASVCATGSDLSVDSVKEDFDYIRCSKLNKHPILTASLSEVVHAYTAALSAG